MLTIVQETRQRALVICGVLVRIGGRKSDIISSHDAANKALVNITGHIKIVLIDGGSVFLHIPLDRGAKAGNQMHDAYYSSLHAEKNTFQYPVVP